MDLKGYPKEMRHPQHIPAVVSGYTRLANGKTKDDPPGRPAWFPPVFVNNLDQEQYYASLGYLPKDVAPHTEAHKRYLATTIGDERPGVKQPSADHPVWLYRLGDDLEVQSALADTPEAEAQLGEGWFRDLAAVKASQAQLKTEEAKRALAPPVPQPVASPVPARKGRKG